MKYNFKDQKKISETVLKDDPGLPTETGPVSGTISPCWPLNGFASGVAMTCTLVTLVWTGWTNPVASFRLSKVFEPSRGDLSESATIKNHIDAKRTVYRTLTMKS